MKLIVAIVKKEDVKSLTEGLSAAGFSVTKMESQGGFLGNQSNVLLVGTDEERIKTVIGIIEQCCRSKKESISPIPQAIEPGELIIPETEKITTSGAIIFVLDVSEIIKL